MTKKVIYCCGCDTDVAARLTTGREVYPHRNDLYSLPFWKCDTCSNFVGCHHKTTERTKPLGVIPTYAIKEARKKIHAILDPLWKSNRMPRGKIYARIANDLGIPEYHTAEIRSVEVAEQVCQIVARLIEEANDPVPDSV